MFKFIKAFLQDDSVFYTILILLVGIGSFGLGKYSVAPEIERSPPQVVLSTNTPASVTNAVQQAESAQYVGSKNGSKYHFLWCPGASQMKEENKIFFNTIEEAKGAGYTPAANCKGL